MNENPVVTIMQELCKYEHAVTCAVDEGVGMRHAMAMAVNESGAKDWLIVTRPMLFETWKRLLNADIKYHFTTQQAVRKHGFKVLQSFLDRVPPAAPTNLLIEWPHSSASTHSALRTLASKMKRVWVRVDWHQIEEWPAYASITVSPINR